MSLKIRGSQKAKLSFGEPKPRGTCWKHNVELSVHLVWTSHLMSHLWLPPGQRANGLAPLTIRDSKRYRWKYCSSHPAARCGVRRGEIWLTPFQELQISFWPLKKEASRESSLRQTLSLGLSAWWGELWRWINSWFAPGYDENCHVSSRGGSYCMLFLGECCWVSLWNKPMFVLHKHFLQRLMRSAASLVMLVLLWCFGKNLLKVKC